MYRTMESIPVLVKAGGIIPLAGEDYMDCHLHNPKELDVYIFAGEPGEFKLYEDDCLEKQDAIKMCTLFSYKPGIHTEISIQLDKAYLQAVSEKRDYKIHLCGVEETKEIVVEMGKEENCSFYSNYKDAEKEMEITIPAVLAEHIKIRMEFDDDSLQQPESLQQVFEVLHRAQIEYDLKEQIYQIIEKDTTYIRKMMELKEMEVEDGLMGAIMEILLSGH